MTGPEHYREAERLANAAATADLPFGHLSSDETLALAQVHATLAHAAATALVATTDTRWSDEDVRGWARVAAVAKPAGEQS